MSHDTINFRIPSQHLDYSLVGEEASRAVERGLAEADWYQCPVPRATLRKLIERRDGPAIRDTLLLFGILVGTGWVTAALWGTWWAVIPYLIYAIFYGTASDSRWHECSHGTPFKTDWLNQLVYEVASFMVMRESVVWRWSHTRHHSDTIIVGRDPEIQCPRPPDMMSHYLSLVAFGAYKGWVPSIFRHAFGRVSVEERTFIPESEFSKVCRNARIYLVLYAAVIACAIFLHSWLPVFLFMLPQFFGTWLMIIHNTPQHAGLAENVLDHRLNCRTVYMNPISRFIYWNMNYHVEHHMYPLVPYHALPKLHDLIKDDCPPPYPSLLSAWREILPTLFKQVKDPAYHVKRKLPPQKPRQFEGIRSDDTEPDADGWIEICPAADLVSGDILRFDHGKKTFALARDADGRLHATDGICTHGNNHLSEGLLVKETIECSKHNGRFNLKDGSPARAPICRGLATYLIKERDGKICINLGHPGGCGTRKQKTLRFRVVSTRSIATFIREIEIESADPSQVIEFEPGDYLQFDIPAYQEIRFSNFDVPEPYASVWRNQHVFDLVASNPQETRRNNYSIASNRNTEKALRFNVRIATPPPGQDCQPGAGSSYMFSLRPGDELTAIGPFGEFHIKPSQKEMVYIGGGAGMAPLRAHLSHLMETEKTARRISFWYGARSKQELFYQDYFEALAAEHGNFRFHVALSSPLPEDNWRGHTGFIHEVVLNSYLANHPNPMDIEFYLCGPPAMIRACTNTLKGLGVEPGQIACDTF